MPVPFKINVLKNFPNNYENARKRTLGLRRKALKNPELKQTLLATFNELLCENWLVPVNEVSVDVHRCCYLPFFPDDC